MSTVDELTVVAAILESEVSDVSDAKIDTPMSISTAMTPLTMASCNAFIKIS